MECNDDVLGFIVGSMVCNGNVMGFNCDQGGFNDDFMVI